MGPAWQRTTRLQSQARNPPSMKGPQSTSWLQGQRCNRGLGGTWLTEQGSYIPCVSFRAPQPLQGASRAEKPGPGEEFSFYHLGLSFPHFGSIRPRGQSTASGSRKNAQKPVSLGSFPCWTAVLEAQLPRHHTGFEPKTWSTKEGAFAQSTPEQVPFGRTAQAAD